MKYRSLAATALLFFLLLAGCGPRHPVIPPDHAIQPDPGIVTGVLPNGFQYILKKNTTPEERVSIHLNVFAGSMHETDEQQGLAHYLEHMLFNGSTHFKPGELVEYFQSIGMDFGADANAHTGMFNTVYDLSLPKGDTAHIEDALLVFEDYARGALLLQEEIDRERGIILAEKRERDSVDYRTFEKSLAFELPGSLYARRFPIGIEEVLNTAGRKQLKQFYDKWYRPDNMVLVAVGDFDIQQVQAMIQKKFSGLTNPSHTFIDSPDTGWTPHEGVKPFYHYEPEAGETNISIEVVKWVPFEYESFQDIQKKTVDNLAAQIVRNRLSRMVSLQIAGFSSASVFTGTVWQNLHISAISAACSPDNWLKSLEQVEQSLRQALVFGFTQKELDRVKSEVISGLEADFKKEETRKSADIARQILNTVNRKGVLLSAQQRMDLLVPFIESLTLEAVNSAFKKSWEQNHRLVMVTGNAEISPDPERRIFRVYHESAEKKIDAFKEFESRPFPYLEKPVSVLKASAVEKNIHGLGIDRAWFDTSIFLLFKPTDYKKNQFSFKLSFGTGLASQPIEKPGLAQLSESVVAESGFGAIDADQLEEALAGRNISFSFGVEQDRFILSGTADPEEAELVFQLIQHFFTDPGFRPQALALAKTRFRQQYDNQIRTADGMMQIKGDRFLAGGDTRFGLPDPDRMDAYTLEDVKNWLTPFIKDSEIELCLAGEMDTKEIMALAARYLSALGQRKDSSKDTEKIETVQFPFGEKAQFDVDSKIDAGIVRVAFKTDDFWNIRQTRRLSLLSRIISERLRKTVREELAAAYAPYAYNMASQIFDGYGVLNIVVPVKSGSHVLVYRSIQKIVDSLNEEGITPKELDLTLKPVMNRIKVFRKTNGYWLNSVMVNSSRHPEKYDWARSMVKDYESVTLEDLADVTKRYLDFEKSASIFIKSYK